MKESEIYIYFFRRNWLVFLGPILVCLIFNIYIYAQIPSRIRISQTFKIQYDLQNLESAIALTDQAVAELRAQKFSNLFSDSEVSIYKSAPFNVTIESNSLNREVSYKLLLKEIEYLRQNFKASEITNPEISQIDPNLFKYLISGLIVGGLMGLLISLIKEYLKNY